MRIGVLGAGGVGGYYAGALARAGHTVRLIARGAHLDAIRKQGGLEIRTPTERYTADVGATDDLAALVGTDAVIVAVKSYSLAEIAPGLRAAAESGAAVLPLLNGVDMADRMAALGIPRGSVIGGATYIIAARTAPGVIERTSAFARVVLGEFDGQPSDRSTRLAAALRDAGAEVTLTDTIAVELWRKFFFIAAMAAACGLARRPIGPLRETPYGRLLLERAAAEVIAVARASGIPIRDDEAERIARAFDGLDATAKPSFLLDLERGPGSPTELDLFSGTVARLGRAAGVTTPVHDTAIGALG